MTQMNPGNSRESPFLTVDETAIYLKLTRSTLDNFRWAGGGPKYRKHGGRVLYHKDELDRWSRDREFKNTGSRTPPER